MMPSSRGKEKEIQRRPTRPPIPYRPSTPYTSDSSQSVESFSFIPWIYTKQWKHIEPEPKHEAPPVTPYESPSPQPPHVQLPKTPSPPPPEPSEPSPPPPLFEKIFNDLKDEDDLNTLTLMLSLEPTISKMNPDIDSHAMVTAASLIISYCGENAFKSTATAAKQSKVEKKQIEPEEKKSKKVYTPILSTDPDTWPGYTGAHEYNEPSDDVSIPTIAVRNHPHFERSIPTTAVPTFRPLVTQSTFVPHRQAQQLLPHIQQAQCTFVPHRQPQLLQQPQAQPQMYQMYHSNHVLVHGNMYSANRNANRVNTLHHVQQQHYTNYNLNQNMNVNTMQYNMAPPDYIYVS